MNTFAQIFPSAPPDPAVARVIFPSGPNADETADVNIHVTSDIVVEAAVVETTAPDATVEKRIADELIGAGLAIQDVG